jgi:chromosome segregation ATPase
MDQLTESKFNYSQLQPEMANFLREKETNMKEIVGSAYTRIGKELKDAQDKLSQNGYGCFQEWYESLGFKKDKVYRMIKRYNLILANSEKQDLIEDLPLSLSYEIAKNSADPELKQQVLDGDITSHKEFKKLKKEKEKLEEEKERLKENNQFLEEIRDGLIKERDQERQKKINVYKQIKELKEKEPETIEKEVIPDDYKKMKEQNRKMKQQLQQKQNELDRLSNDIKELSKEKEIIEEKANLNEKEAEEYKQLKNKIKNLKEQKNSIHRKFEAVGSVADFVTEIESFLQNKLAPVKYSRALIEASDDEIVVRNVKEIVGKVREWCNEVEDLLPEKKNYIDAEVIDSEQ